ncbi:MAG: hypothetical protein NT150_00165 [Bacteroidetes bacterium]|nr:hypothetical protein [Bacteroidota bacterium]
MIESFLNFFTFKRFALGAIVIFLAPLADVSPILFDGEVAEAKCTEVLGGTSYDFSRCSIEFIASDYAYTVEGDGVYDKGEDLHLMYEKENPSQFVELSFTGIYLNGLGIASIFLFLLWFSGYYSSLDKKVVSASTSEKIYDVLFKILIAFLIIVAGGIILVLPCFIIAKGTYEQLVGWAIFVTGMFASFILLYKNNPDFAGKVNLFFKKKSSETELSKVPHENPIFNSPPEKISFFKNLFHSGTDHDFERFSKKMFIIGIIVLLFAPAIGALGPFITARHGEGKCIGYSYNRSQNIVYSIIEFYPKDSKIAVHYPDDLNLFEVNQQVDLLYIPENQGKVLTLTFFSLYTNFWTGIAFGLLIIWIAAYYASRA